MSRIAELIDSLERNEPVDLQKVLRLQALDMARVGETFVEETITRERQADDQFAERVE